MRYYADTTIKIKMKKKTKPPHNKKHHETEMSDKQADRHFSNLEKKSISGNKSSSMNNKNQNNNKKILKHHLCSSV